MIARLTVLVLAVLAGVVAIFSIWANGELLDTGGWASVSGNLLESKEVRHRVAAFLGEELVADTEAQLLAAGQEEVAAAVIPRLRRRQAQLAERVMTTPRFHRIWEEANRGGQRALVRVLDEEGPARHGAVVVDLTPALRQLAEEIEDSGVVAGFGVTNLAGLVEPGAARIKILEAQELSQAQDLVRVVRHLTLPAILVVVLLYALALFLDRDRLARGFLGVGVAFVATGVLALLVRTVAGHQIVDRLLTDESDRKAADAAWGIVTSTVAELAGWAIGLGIATVLAVGALALFSRAREPR